MQPSSSLPWSALLLGLLGFATHVATTLWFNPLTWDMSETGRWLALLGSLLVTVLVLYGIFFLINRGIRKLPTAFVPGKGRLTALNSPVLAGTQVILLMYIAGGVVPIEREGDRMRFSTEGSFWLVSLILIVLILAGALAYLLVRLPRLELDPEGLTVVRLFNSTRVAWDQIAPGSPVAPTARRDRHLWIRLKSPRGVDPSIPINRLYIDPAFLADAIRHYAEHPEDRATIGDGATVVARGERETAQDHP